MRTSARVSHPSPSRSYQSSNLPPVTSSPSPGSPKRIFLPLDPVDPSWGAGAQLTLVVGSVPSFASEAPSYGTSAVTTASTYRLSCWPDGSCPGLTSVRTTPTNCGAEQRIRSTVAAVARGTPLR
jgi:hypothetical protein